jgi:hypothetical protein
LLVNKIRKGNKSFFSNKVPGTASFRFVQLNASALCFKATFEEMGQVGKTILIKMNSFITCLFLLALLEYDKLVLCLNYPFRNFQLFPNFLLFYLLYQSLQLHVPNHSVLHVLDDPRVNAFIRA